MLSAVANDYGRWTTLAVTAAWLAAVALRLIQAEPVVARPIDYIVALALLAVLFGMRLASISYPNVATKAVAERLSGAPSKTLFGYATACDPDWRALVARYAAGAP